MIYIYLLYMKMIGYQKKQRSIRNTQKRPLTLHHPKTPTISLATLPSATSKVKHRFGLCGKKQRGVVPKKNTVEFRGRIFPCFFAKGLNSVKQPGGCLVDVCCCCFKAQCQLFVTFPGEKRNNLPGLSFLFNRRSLHVFSRFTKVC